MKVVNQLHVEAYNRQAAIAYAKEWAMKRNPAYYNFDNLGGDCTNFVSQCIYTGSRIMNHMKDLGWYYYSPNNRAPSWTGVPFLYNFLVGNKGVGPFGEAVDSQGMQPGDVVQLGTAEGRFYHTLLVTGMSKEELYVSAHTFDAYQRPLRSYVYDQARFIHIAGVRKY